MILKIKTAFRVVKKVKNWPLYFLNYLRPGERPKFLKLRNGVILKIRPKTMDRATFNAIWLNDIYTPSGFEINKDDTVLDIGAHTGLFSIFAASKGAEVYSFEPAPDNLLVLRENIELNKITNIKVFNFVMAGVSGEKKMYFYADNPSAHAFSSIAEKSGNETVVPAVSLEKFIKDNRINAIDFLKMNCEGAEYEILFNCPIEILRMVKKISIQCHDIDESKNMNKMKIFLEKMGFNAEIGSKKYNTIYARQRQ